MKLVLLHGLGQTAADWRTVAERAGFSEADCPELFSTAGGACTHCIAAKRRLRWC